MRRESSFGIAALVAIAAALGVSVRSPKQEGASEGSHVQTTVSHHTASKEHKSSACAELGEHLEDFLDINNGQLPTPCDAPSSSSANPKGKWGLKFAIATLPDPLHTHLAVSFDEAIATIQDAAQDEGYDFDSSWLPWDQQDEPPYSHLGDQEQADEETKEREQQPGILLFRRTVDDRDNVGADDRKSGERTLTMPPTAEPGVKTFSKQDDTGREHQEPSNEGATAPFVTRYRQGLVVFVAGEDATHGIHRHQFRNALEWIQKLAEQGLGRSDRTLILGPTFSGSFASLAELLSDPEVAKRLGLQDNNDNAPLPIYAGGVSGSNSAKWFQQQMDDRYGQNPQRVSFHSFVQNDDQIVERFLKYLNERRPDFDYGKVAILSEDQTAYGQEMVSFPSKTLQMYYPRDISALRGAYQTQSLFDTTISEEPQNQPRRSLPTDLADPTGIVHDSVHTYGGNQTPLVQEAFLLQIVTALRQRGVRYVLLRGSNPLDQLFLTNFLHRLYPDARIVIVTSDLLFIRERGTTGLSGVMTLSTYPLSPLARHWTERPHLPANDRVFSSDISEGLYNAFRLLLDANPTPQQPLPRCRVTDSRLFLPVVSCSGGPAVNDYAPPLWLQPSNCKKNDPNCSYPGPYVWLSVIGVNRFWPLASLGPDPATSQTCPADKDSQPTAGRVGVPLVMQLALLALLAFSLFHLYCCASGSFMAKPSFRAYFAGKGDPKQTVLICLGSSLVAFAAIAAGWSCGVFSRGSVAMPYSWFAFCGMVGVTLLAWRASISHSHRVDQLNQDTSAEKACSEKLPESSKETTDPAKPIAKTKAAEIYCELCTRVSKDPFRQSMAYWLPFPMIVLFLCAFVVLLELALSPENRFLTYWRSMSLGSGLSPLVPFFALLIGLYSAFWFAVHGLALLGPDRPRLPQKKDLEFQITHENEGVPACSAETAAPDTHKDVLRMFSQDAGDDIEFEAAPLRLARTIGPETHPELSSIQLDFRLPLTAIVFIFSWAISAALAGGIPIRSLGHRYTSIVFLSWLLVSASLLLATCWRMYRLWAELRQLLEFLDRTPLRRTMDAIHGFSWESVWKMSGNVLAVRYKLISRQLESMNHTITSLEQIELSSEGSITVDSAKDLIKCLTCLRNVGHQFADWYLENYTNETAGDLRAFKRFQEKLAAVCGTLLTKVLIPAWKAEEKSLISTEEEEGEASNAAKKIAPLSEEPSVRNAEELVCLMYLGFIQNILGRVRTMAISIVALFVSCSVAISTYPLDPRQPLSGALIGLFVLSSAAMVLVYAGMHRDATLSHVTNTTPGELGSEFWIKLVIFGLPPLLGLIARVFPGVTDFFFTWLQPGLSSLK